MSLTDLKIKNAAIKEKPYKLSDSGGLHTLISPSGSKLWRFSYRFQGKQKLLALGGYPLVSLKDAREQRDAAKRQLLEGVDPNEIKKAKKREETNSEDTSFEFIARQWHEHWKVEKNEKSTKTVLTRLEANVFPLIGKTQIAQILPKELVEMTKKIDQRGTSEVAKRCFRVCGQIFRYAIAHGLANRNPVAEVRESDFLKPRTVVNLARIDYRELPAFLNVVEDYSGSILTRLAMKLLALTFVRTNELLGARWCEIDLVNAIWTIPASRMKKKKQGDHIVPLCAQAIEILKLLNVLTGHRELVFPNERDHSRCMSKGTILSCLQALGYKGKMTGHGFRGLASTILNEAGFNFLQVELQLHHVMKNQVAGAYNHAKYMDQRKVMMQWWGDYLDQARAGQAYPYPKLPLSYSGS